MTDKEPTPQITHAEGCYAWGPAHYECALKAIAAEREAKIESQFAQQQPLRVVAQECAERGCMAHDDRVDGPGVVVLIPSTAGPSFRALMQLTPTEIGEVIASLESDGHTEDDLEADCPACTAAQKLRALQQQRKP